MPGEFELIQRYFASRCQQGSADVPLGIGDDCALIRIPAGMQLAQSLDTLVADVHFPADADPWLLGWRALACNLSDLAAMGAEPHSFTLGLTLPQADSSWLERFSLGLATLAERSGIRLIGGDTTRGPLTISIQVQGLVPDGEALQRNHAQPGQLVCVSGTIGDSGAALALVKTGAEPDTAASAAERWLLERYYQPEPMLALGAQLRTVGCRCGIDISDGLLADLGHILQASGVGAELDLELLPRSEPARATGQSLPEALTSGDDYQLCFCIDESDWSHLQQLGPAAPVTAIGRITSNRGLRGSDGQPLVFANQGYQHFR